VHLCALMHPHCAKTGLTGHGLGDDARCILTSLYAIAWAAHAGHTLLHSITIEHFHLSTWTKFSSSDSHVLRDSLHSAAQALRAAPQSLLAASSRALKRADTRVPSFGSLRCHSERHLSRPSHPGPWDFPAQVTDVATRTVRTRVR